MITFFAPFSRCGGLLTVVNRPVDSITTSTPSSPHVSAPGSGSASTCSGGRRDEPSPAASTSPGYGPKIESYLNRCASVAVSVRSLTATHSMSGASGRALAARMTLRPIRPETVDSDPYGHPVPPKGPAAMGSRRRHVRGQRPWRRLSVLAQAEICPPNPLSISRWCTATSTSRGPRSGLRAALRLPPSDACRRCSRSPPPCATCPPRCTAGSGNRAVRSRWP